MIKSLRSVLPVQGKSLLCTDKLVLVFYIETWNELFFFLREPQRHLNFSIIQRFLFFTERQINVNLRIRGFYHTGKIEKVFIIGL